VNRCGAENRGEYDEPEDFQRDLFHPLPRQRHVNDEGIGGRGHQVEDQPQ
jgi:hypothetical protein